MTVLIPSHNGSALLSQYLPRVLETTGLAEVIVVDDCSTDGSVDMLHGKFPGVKVIARKTNGGFSAAVNDGLRMSRGELIVLLNNDVEISSGFLEPLAELFEDSSVFAASPRILLPSRGDLDEGAKTGFWHHGLFYTGQRQGVSEKTPVLYATGCAAVLRRSMLESLGGFDEAYSPFYWEDVDLCYRAWKRGWKTIYQPASIVRHRHSATISRWPRAFTDSIKARNGLLFIWRNIEDVRLLRAHRRWLPFVIARRMLSGDLSFVNGWRRALSMRLEARVARDRDSSDRVLTDQAVFEAAGVAVPWACPAGQSVIAG